MATQFNTSIGDRIVQVDDLDHYQEDHNNIFEKHTYELTLKEVFKSYKGGLVKFVSHFHHNGYGEEEEAICHFIHDLPLYDEIEEFDPSNKESWSELAEYGMKIGHVKKYKKMLNELKAKRIEFQQLQQKEHEPGGALHHQTTEDPVWHSLYVICASLGTHHKSRPQQKMDAIELVWRNLDEQLMETVELSDNKRESIRVEQSGHRKQQKMKVKLGEDIVECALAGIADMALDLVTAFGGGDVAEWAGATGAFGTVLSLGIAPAVHAEWKKFYRKQHNQLAEQFNSKLKRLQKLEADLLENKQKMLEYEKELNSTQFLCELEHNEESRVIVCIGPTGWGKSVVCNRFIGDRSSTEDLEECKDATFNVAQSGQFESETKKLQKAMKKVYIMNKPHNTERASFIVSVVDTPGAFDSDDRDDDYNSQMAEFFKASGGVNMFCVFFKYGSKGDVKYKQLLKLYTKFWGKEFWKHCVIIITHCDKSNQRKLNNGVPRTKASIQKFLEDELNVNEEIPMYAFGEHHFQTSVEKIFLSLIAEQSVYASKYQCDEIVSPIEELWNETKKMYDEYRALGKALQKMTKQIEEARERGKMFFQEYEAS